MASRQHRAPVLVRADLDRVQAFCDGQRVVMIRCLDDYDSALGVDLDGGVT